MKRILVSFIVLVFSGCSSVPESIDSDSMGGNNKLLVEQYLIGVDDRVEVNVWKHPDLSITVPVRPDGMISVPLIGEVLAGGRSPKSVAAEIQKRLSKYIKQPNVAVILFELNSHEFLSRVRVTGAVRSPLSITFRQGMTVLDVVLEAGGLNEFASANNTKLFRQIDGKLKSYDIDLEDIFIGGDMSSNIAMQPGDILSVPERAF